MKLEKYEKASLLTSIFFIGAISGYIYEVIFYFLTENRLDNAGLLIGPWLPIYGTGALLIYLLGSKLKDKPPILFGAIILITGILEYLVGLFYYHVFHLRLWDYRHLFLNINGFVCFRSVITFAIGGMLLMYGIIPLLKKINQNKGYYKILYNIQTILVIIFIIDLFFSNYLHHLPYLY